MRIRPRVLLVYVPAAHSRHLFPDTYVPGAQTVDVASAGAERLMISTTHASRPINESKAMSMKECEGASRGVVVDHLFISKKGEIRP